MDATTAPRQPGIHPTSYYWSMVKNIADSQKLELISLLAHSLKPHVGTPPIIRYTMDDINAMLDEAEAEIAAGGGIPDEEAWDDLQVEPEHERQLKIEIPGLV